VFCEQFRNLIFQAHSGMRNGYLRPIATESWEFRAWWFKVCD
jgi:hypothetical protein